MRVMRVLVLSDSHCGLSFMRRCIRQVRPQVLIHLGDYYADGQEMAEEYPDCRMIQVPGNCDMHRNVPIARDILETKVDGAVLYLAHGHRHYVKSGTGRLLADARAAHAAVALYGHTHEAECYCDGDGMWVMNPGTCATTGGSVGLMEIEDGKILSARILTVHDLDSFA